MSFADVPPVALQLNQGYLVATLQFMSDARVLERFRVDLLERLKTSEVKGVAIDLSSVDMLDATDFASIKQTVDMAVLLGARVVLVGIRPGVAASLVELPVDLRNVKTALTLEAATALLGSSR
jgi:rsbT antagonist protein RsbS